MINIVLNFLMMLVIVFVVRKGLVDYFVSYGQYPQSISDLWKTIDLYGLIHKFLYLLFSYSVLVHHQALGIILLIFLMAKACLTYLRKNSIRTSFIRDSYQIYKYINQQVVSGVRFSEALLSSHHIIVNTSRAQIIHLFSEHILLKQDTNDASMILKEYYNEEEVDLFTMIIEQELFYGSDQRRLMRFEMMMNEKYQYYLQSLSERSKKQMIKQAAWMLLLFILSIMLPLVSVAMKGVFSLLH